MAGAVPDLKINNRGTHLRNRNHQSSCRTLMKVRFSVMKIIVKNRSRTMPWPLVGTDGKR